MCDTYIAKCSKEGCNIQIPIHIVDYCTDRSNVIVFCYDHIKDAKVGTRIFTFKKPYNPIDKVLPPKIGIYVKKKLSIELLNGIHPNTFTRFIYMTKKIRG
jgi:hypothetical protein